MIKQIKKSSVILIVEESIKDKPKVRIVWLKSMEKRAAKMNKIAANKANKQFCQTISSI